LPFATQRWSHIEPSPDNTAAAVTVVGAAAPDESVSVTWTAAAAELITINGALYQAPLNALSCFV